MAVSVHPARAQDVPTVRRLLEHAGYEDADGSTLLRWAHITPSATTFVAREDGRIVGTATAFSFGTTSWIGGVGVVPASRRKGIGSAVTVAALERLCQDGRNAVSLLATNDGAALYRRLGFVDEADTAVFVSPGTRTGKSAPTAPLGAARLPEAAAVDAAATGEHRAPVLSLLSARSLVGVRSTEGSGLLGYSGRAWGHAGPVVAVTPAAGVALLERALATEGRRFRAAIPVGNAAAMEWAQERRLRLHRTVRRMTMGQAPPWDAAMIFRHFNLYWG